MSRKIIKGKQTDCRNCVDKIKDTLSPFTISHNFACDHIVTKLGKNRSIYINIGIYRLLLQVIVSFSNYLFLKEFGKF